MAIKWIGTVDAMYYNNKWNDRADIWHCTKCNSTIWSIPPVQKCFRKEYKCPSCESRKQITTFKKFIKWFIGGFKHGTY